MNLRPRGAAGAPAVCALFAALLVSGCRRAPPDSASAAGSARDPLPRAGETYPVHLEREAFAGSQACASCHAAEHEAWLKSPHGRATRDAAPAHVLADFSAAPLAIEGGQVAFSREGDRFFMEVRDAAGRGEKRSVDLAIGSGRQHQDYFTKEVDPVNGAETWRMLPALWATREKRWLPLSLYQPGSAERRSPNYWARRDLNELGCFNCHVSQGGYRLGASGPQPLWTETPINCESCHGPGAGHVAKRRAGQAGGAMRDLKNVSPADEAQTCGVCHGERADHAAGTAPSGYPWFAADTLRVKGLRADATQLLTSYQFSGHVLSQCFRGGGLLCSSCHAPHSGEPRALDGEPALGAQSDKQCIACHRNYLDAKAALAHGHHRDPLRCIDCHMAPSWMGDTRQRAQRTADHAISIPRPEESLDFGTPDACTTCHAGKTPKWALETLRGWGAKSALGVRDWVRAAALGKRREPAATPLLLALLREPKSGDYLDATALDLLEAMPPDPSLEPQLTPWTTNADPWIRVLAFRALFHHAPAQAEALWLRAQADPSSLVRAELFPRAPALRLLSREKIEGYLRDEREWAQRPDIEDLLNAARVLDALGEPRRALEVVNAAILAGPPAELEQAHADRLREALLEKSPPAGPPR